MSQKRQKPVPKAALHKVIRQKPQLFLSPERSQSCVFSPMYSGLAGGGEYNFAPDHHLYSLGAHPDDPLLVCQHLMHTRQKPGPQVSFVQNLGEAGFELWALVSSNFRKWPSCGFLLTLSRVSSNLTSNYNRQNLG